MALAMSRPAAPTNRIRHVVRALPAVLAAGGLATALAGCGSGTGTANATTGLPGLGRPSVTIGDMNYTEQFVLGELYDQALSAKGFSVSLDRNIGPLQVRMQALSTGKLAMYPEYLNVLNMQVAGYRHTFASSSGAWKGAQHWASRHGLKLLAPTPFSDTADIAVLRSYARRHGIGSLRGLRRVASELTLGAPAQFVQSADGLPALEQLYGFAPAHVTPIDIGSQYQSLQQGQIQAAYINTTDGALTNRAFLALRDPRKLFGFGNVVPVVTKKALAAEGPAFARTIEAVDRLLSLRVMRELNAEVDLQGETPEAVAKAFLQQRGLIPPSSSP
jgi:osmoprotectant transport system substrate-binding protein